MDPLKPQTPAQEVRLKNGELAKLIRSVVARHLGVTESEVTNWTKLGNVSDSVFSELNHHIGKVLPQGTNITPDTDLVTLTALYRDA